MMLEQYEPPVQGIAGMDNDESVGAGHDPPPALLGGDQRGHA
jgi:hypothetical protein